MKILYTIVKAENGFIISTGDAYNAGMRSKNWILFDLKEISDLLVKIENENNFERAVNSD